MIAARKLAEAISLGVRERRLRRAGYYAEREIAEPPMPLDALPESDQRDWLDTAETVLAIYGAPPPPEEEGMGFGPEHDASLLWQAVAIIGVLWSLTAMVGSVVLALSHDWAEATYVVALGTWVLVSARDLWKEST